MTTWTDIFPDVDGPPVRGEPLQFTRVAHSFDSMHDDAVEILTQFKRIMGEGSFDEIQGEVAGPFRTFVDNVNDRLQSLPDVSSTASTIFADHAGRLDDYRTAADKALASAITKWSERKSVAGQLDAASDAEAKAKTKVDSTPPDADPTATSDAQDAHDQAAQHVTDVKNKLAGIDGELKQFRAKWNELRGDEKDLSDSTKHRLDDVDLHDLHDPGWFDSFCEAVGDFLQWAYKFTGLEDLVELIDAIAHGDWAAVLWRLRDLLDKVFVILSVVALICCPALLLVALVVIAVAKLAIDVGLYMSNTADPKTGRRISAMDLAFDVFDAATAGHAAWAHEASALSKGKTLVDDVATYTARADKSAALRGFEDGAVAYNKKLVGTQQKFLLEKFGLQSQRVIYERAPKKALYTIEPQITGKFVIQSARTAQDVVVKPVAVTLYAVDQGKEAAAPPSIEKLEQSMQPQRPFFSELRPARVVDFLAEAHRW